MKYLFTILFLFLLSSPALAARQVPGTTASTSPLQPIPVDVGVNYTKNIEATQERPVESDLESQEESFEQAKEASKVAVAESSFSVSQHLGLKIFLSIVAVLLGGYVVLKAFFKHDKK